LAAAATSLIRNLAAAATSLIRKSVVRLYKIRCASVEQEAEQ